MCVARACVVIVLASTFPWPALAQEPSAEDLAGLEEAYETEQDPGLLFEIGRTLFELGRLEEAQTRLEAYLELGPGDAEDHTTQAQALLYQIIVATNVDYKEGKELLGKGQYVAAGKKLRAYLKLEGEELSDEREKEVLALLEESESHIGYVKFSCNVAAEIIVSGLVQGTCPIEDSIALDEGKYPVSAVAQGYEMASKVIGIQGGEKKLIKIVLEPDVRDRCAGITCSDHGWCHDEDEAPACVCDPGYTLTSSGLDCMLDIEGLEVTKNRAYASLALNSLAWLLTTTSGILFGAFVLEAAIPMMAVSVLMFEIGVPLAIESYIRGSRIVGHDADGPSPTIYRGFGIALFTAVGPCLPWSFMGAFPAIIIGGAHLVAAGVIGLVLSIRNVRDYRTIRETAHRTGVTVLPYMTAVEGGAVLGLGGTF